MDLLDDERFFERNNDERLDIQSSLENIVCTGRT